MPRRTTPSLNPNQPHGRGAGGQANSRRLESLTERFSDFHQRHRRQTRIPEDLRRAAVKALQFGITRTQLRKTCGISSKQIDHWLRAFGKRSSAATTKSATPRPRVFAVVDEKTSSRRTADPEPQPDLELRLGSWSICVRQLGQAVRDR